MKGPQGKSENKLELDKLGCGREIDSLWNNTMKPLLQLGISFL